MKLFNKGVALTIKLRHLLILGCLLGILLVVGGWVYMDNIRAATTKTTYAWVSDSTEVVSAPIDPSSEFRQRFTTSDPIFGGGFVFSIYDQICYGTVTLSLQDQSGQTLASTSMLGIDLYDNTFQHITFPEGIYPDGETSYDFVITFTPESEQSSLGVWVSATPSDSIAPYTLNGETADTCASFAIVTNYAGSFIVGAFFACLLFAMLTLAAGYYLIFIRKAKLHILFIFFALTLGVLYMALIPPYVAPDEETHIHTAYALSNNFLGIENDIYVSLRASDDIAFDKADELDIYSYQTVAQELFGQCADSTMVSTDNAVVYTEPFYIYLPTAIGLTIARLCNFNYITLIFFGRVMNLLVYTAIVALAIAQMPRFKRILCVVALLPMSLQLAAAFNYDAIVLATAFLYTAVVLKTLTSEGDFSPKQLLLVVVLGLLLAPMKKLYVFLCLFCCILPLKRCPALVQKWFWKVVLLGVVGFICLIPTFLDMMWVSKASLEVASMIVLPEVNPLNVDYSEQYFWTVPYLLTHLTGAVKMVLRTIQENTGLYFVQLIGGKAGEYILRDITIWAPLIGVLYGVLFLCAVPTDQEKPLLSLPQKCWSGLLLLATLGALFFVCLTWTPLRNTTIWGLQGRYFLPVLPLVLLMIQNKGITLRSNIERPLLLTVVFSNLIAMASVFQQIMTF